MYLESVVNDEEDIGKNHSTHFLVRQWESTLDDQMPFGLTIHSLAHQNLEIFYREH